MKSRFQNSGLYSFFKPAGLFPARLIEPPPKLLPIIQNRSRHPYFIYVLFFFSIQNFANSNSPSPFSLLSYHSVFCSFILAFSFLVILFFFRVKSLCSFFYSSPKLSGIFTKDNVIFVFFNFFLFFPPKFDSRQCYSIKFSTRVISAYYNSLSAYRFVLFQPNTMCPPFFYLSCLWIDLFYGRIY